MTIKPKQFYFSLWGLLAGLVILGAAAYTFELSQVKTTAARLKQQLADQQVSEFKLEQQQALRRQLQTLGPILPTIDSALPKTKQQSEIILQLQQVATGSGMTLPGASFTASSLPTSTSQTTKVGDALALPVSFQLTGTYDQLINFLTQVEHLGRYSSVNSLGIARGGGPKTLTFNISLNAFFKP